jgi:hypothetical protein
MNTLMDTLHLIEDETRWALQESQHQELLMAIAVVAGTVLLVQLALAFWTFRRLGEMATMRERTSRLFDSLALLTDTTEAGLATVIQEVGRINRRPAEVRQTRSTVASRVADAASRGLAVADIAQQEGISEGEVHLHLKLAQAAAASRPAAHAVGA